MGKRAKTELRAEMQRVLANLDRRWLQAASRELCRNLSYVLDKELGNGIEHVLAWVNFFPGEVDLSTFINEQFDRREIYLPQIRDNKMHFISIGRDWSSLMAQGTYGIPEPQDTGGTPFPAAEAGRTAIIVPGLAFDRSGGRLGRGKGYYDTFLGRSQLHDITKIGVCWSLQTVAELHTESHDIFMDWVVTEEERISIVPPKEI